MKEVRGGFRVSFQCMCLWEICRPCVARCVFFCRDDLEDGGNLETSLFCFIIGAKDG